MTHVVSENCIKCKYTDGVDVCPVDCFREGPNMLVIDPDECIDCAVCIPECPANAIFAEEDATQLEPNAIGHIELLLQEPVPGAAFEVARVLGSMILVDTATHKTAGAVLLR